MEMSKAQKLLELRAKTDCQLTVLANRLVERGRVAEAVRLLPLLSSIDRRHLELKLTRAGELLPRKSVCAA